ncbi:hypothetical protein [Moritella sp. Urea-trap-13]|uniref:hypothetical protein n=1 Tax=Moritella sp. Urea-trap-13 TaxID=2058327 RepID=UPI000C33CC60|nr:hypothetical protein [Moritella sp. Urea-trap-13]PKH04717.1 hypothetical protein CXF93_21100 [Moritella sp. Urea-trap-13]
MSKIDFSAINKSSSNSFHEQRNTIKKVCLGKTVLCPVCQQALKLLPPKNKNDASKTGVSCAKGCTFIELEFEL